MILYISTVTRFNSKSEVFTVKKYLRWYSAAYRNRCKLISYHQYDAAEIKGINGTNSLSSLSADFTKWSITLKQFVGNLNVFHHFVGLALKGSSSYEN